MIDLGTCVQNCGDVTWSHVTRQLLLGGIPWSVLVCIGVVTTLVAPAWSSNGRKKLMRYDCGLASRSLTSALAVLIAHFLQCIAFIIRASTFKVDTAYHAIEVFLTLLIFVDIMLSWAYVISRGRAAVLISAFDKLIVDCLTLTSFIGVLLAGSDGLKTWWSFGFLASLRMIRCLWKAHVVLEFVERGGYVIRGIYHSFALGLFVYFCAMTMISLEYLKTPVDSKEEDGSWGVFGSILFVVSTMSTVGDTKLAPVTILGRCFAIWLVCWSFYAIGSKVSHLVLDYMTGRNIGRGSFRGAYGHVVLIGTPTGPMILDFLTEAYHLNHYESGDQFDREAPEICILLNSRQSLRHISQFLDRRESMLFRNRVTVLYGEPSDSSARKRGCLNFARQIVVLPNLTTSNAHGDDSQNIMRAFAVNSAVPHVPVVCMLHRLEHKPSAFASKDGNCTFVSIEAFKLALLAKACLVPGVATFLCNLCKTTGKSEDAPESWQVDYEQGLDMELYQVPLSPCYHDETFGDIVTDVLARAVHGDVYLVGLAETQLSSSGQAKERLRIHPGADFVVDNLDGSMRGIFMATSINAIQQLNVNDFLLGPAGHKGKKSDKKHLEDGDDDGSSTSSPSRRSSKKTPAIQETEAHLTEFKAFAVNREVISAEEKERQEAVQSYDVAMRDLGQKMLAGGMEAGVIAQITTTDENTKPIARTTSILDNKKNQALKALADESHVPDLDDLMDEVGAAANSADMGKIITKLGRLHRIQERIDHDAKRPPDPPASVIDNGGHLLLCIVTATSSETNTEAAVGELGPQMGIEHFMRPLRDGRLGQMQPTLVVLAEQLPSDWHCVAEDSKTYFVCGSPLSLVDLDRAGFRKANAIAIARCHVRAPKNVKKIADARAILATNVIEAQFTRSAPPPVITDLAYDASVDFLPLSQTMVLAMQYMKPNPMKRSAGGITDFIQSPFDGEAKDESVEAQYANERALGETNFEDDYEILEAPDYIQHPRYMCGMVFVCNSITSLIANMLHNQFLIPLVANFLQAPFLLLHVPIVWTDQCYADLCEWLLKKRNLLALGLYRNSTAMAEREGTVDSKRPSLYYMFTAPPAYKTVLCRSDRILVLAPSGGG